MIELLIVVIVLVVIAWLCYTYLPHPLGLIIAVVCGIIILVVLLRSVGDVDMGWKN